MRKIRWWSCRPQNSRWTRLPENTAYQATGWTPSKMAKATHTVSNHSMVLTTPLFGSLLFHSRDCTRTEWPVLIHREPREKVPLVQTTCQATCQTSSQTSDEPSFGQGLTTFRTDITDAALKSLTSRDPARWCVVHKLSHPLSKCRALKAMPLTERKNLLSQHRIRFHCLATTYHLAKNCVTQVKCSECHNDKHVAALHAGPPGKPGPEEVELSDTHQYGGEPVVTSSCIEVCRNTMTGKFCAKICLVNLYSNSQPENKIKAYVVIDDQSNCSLAKLNLGGKATHYMLKTCSGTRQAIGRRAHNRVTCCVTCRVTCFPSSQNVVLSRTAEKKFQLLQFPEPTPIWKLSLRIRRSLS